MAEGRSLGRGETPDERRGRSRSEDVFKLTLNFRTIIVTNARRRPLPSPRPRQDRYEGQRKWLELRALQKGALRSRVTTHASQGGRDHKGQTRLEMPNRGWRHVSQEGTTEGQFVIKFQWERSLNFITAWFLKASGNPRSIEGRKMKKGNWSSLNANIEKVSLS